MCPLVSVDFMRCFLLKRKLDRHQSALLGSNVPMPIYALPVRLSTGAGNVAYCTFPVTEALPLMVNVQVLVLLPPLAHAPDQMTSRPLVALKVIELLLAKLAD
ncbi:MAG: hypothetical protein ACREXQ_10085 [Polaromonas sp.]